MADQPFRQFFTEAYQGTQAKKGALTFDVRASNELLIEKKLGHPEFEKLQLGQSTESENVMFFLDVRGCTKMAIALESDELLRIIQALTVACIRTIALCEGYVAEFTGDGVMAYFGDSSKTAEQAAFSSLATASFLMKGIRDVVNLDLSKQGNETLRVAIGMEFGNILWSRIGMRTYNQVKPISEAAFLAGKLTSSRHTGPWECKTGPVLAEWIAPEFRKPAGAYKFQFDGKSYAREIYMLKWEEFGAEYDLKRELLKGQMLRKKLGRHPSLAATVLSGPPPSPGQKPRPLKDQPFF